MDLKLPGNITVFPWSICHSAFLNNYLPSFPQTLNRLPPPSLPSDDNLPACCLKKTEALRRVFFQTLATHLPCSSICTIYITFLPLPRDELSMHLAKARTSSPFHMYARYYSSIFLPVNFFSFSCSIIFFFLSGLAAKHYIISFIENKQISWAQSLLQLLSHFSVTFNSKIPQKIVYTSSLQFLSSPCVLNNPLQSGCCPHGSFVTALINSTNDFYMINFHGQSQEDLPYSYSSL